MKIRHKIFISIVMSSIVLSASLISFFVIKSSKELEKNIYESISNQNDSLMGKVNFINELKTLELANISRMVNSNSVIKFNSIYFDTVKYIPLTSNQLKNNLIEQTIELSLDQNEKIYNKTYLLNKFGFKSGILLGVMSKDRFYKLLKLSFLEPRNAMTGKIQIIDSFGHTVFSNLDSTTLNENDYFKSSFKYTPHKNKFEKWEVTIRQSKLNFTNSIQEQLKILCIFALLFTGVIVYIANIVAESITRPIELASEAVSEVGFGNFLPIQQISYSNDEYGELINTLQTVTKKVEALINDQATKHRYTALGKMAGSVAHEINNPLHLINNHALLLNKILLRSDFNITNELDREKIKRSFKTINETVHRISHIISGMKSLARDGSNDPYVTSELSDIITGTVSMCYENLKNKDIKLKLKHNNEKISLDCRPGQIQQVLLNLLNNSIDSLKDSTNKWIELNIVTQQKYLVFEITNSGVKKEPEESKNVFTLNYYASNDSISSGLGLSISKNIIHAHNGTLHYDSEREINCFIIRIPISQEQDEDLEFAS